MQYFFLVLPIEAGTAHNAFIRFNLCLKHTIIFGIYVDLQAIEK